MALVTAFWGLDGMLVAIAAILGAYLYMTRKFGYWKKRGFPELRPTPFTGNLTDCLLMRKSPGQFLKDLYDRSSNLPYVGFYSLDTPFFLLRDPELIKNVLVRHSNHFTDRNASASPEDTFGKANLFIVKNPAWKLIKSKLTSFFTSGKLKKMFELMLEVGEDLENHLDSLDFKGEGRTVELKELCAKFTIDLIATTAWGLKVNSLNNSDAEFHEHTHDMLHGNLWRSYEMLANFFAPQLMKVMGFKFWPEKTTDFLRQVFWDTLIAREKSAVNRNDLIDLLIDLKNNQNEGPEKQIFDFSGDNLVAQAALFIAAGFETTASAISFTLYELAIAPKLQTKLREEIKDALEKNDGRMTYEMVMTLPYLNMVVSETLRKYPPATLLDRMVTSDYKIPNSNVVLEKGTPTFIPLLGLHYDPHYFPNPDVYDPERFSEENRKNRKACVYLPFGDGPHICIGMRLGILQVNFGLIKFLTNYEFSPCKETVIPLKLNPKSLLSESVGGLNLNIRKIMN